MGKNKGRRAPRRPEKARKPERDDGDQKEPAVVMDAVVSQALPNAMFEVELENGHKLIAYAAGRMRRSHRNSLTLMHMAFAILHQRSRLWVRLWGSTT